jgi:hypothetical protein
MGAMDENPYRAPTTPEPAQRHTFWFPLAFYALAIVAGIRGAYASQSSKLDLLLPIAEAVCLGWWALVDARRRGHYIPTTARWWFVVLAGIVVPAYVIWSRGWRGLVWVAVNFFAWVALTTLAVTVCAALLSARG